MDDDENYADFRDTVLCQVPEYINVLLQRLVVEVETY